MKSILISRHSFAEDSFSKPDFEREITKQGFKRIETQAKRLKENKVKVDLIICSSAKRTKQTALYYKELLSIDPEIVDYPWLYEEYPTYQLLNLIQSQSNRHQTIMIVGHNKKR